MSTHIDGSDAQERHGGRRGPWQQAREAARETSPDRNRYVDLLRAASIFVVVVGHWLMAAPTAETGVRFTLSDMLGVAPWTQWLTWIFQVMPVFFMVGGYANAASWESARAAGRGYDAWLSRRLQRLIRPVVPFVLVWWAGGFAARWLGLGREIVTTGSRAAFLPTWFLAFYVVVVVLAPAMHRWWSRLGMTSFWTLVLGAVVVDVVARSTGFAEVRWLNYGFVWLAIHQLGFAWRDGTLSEPVRALSFALAGFAALVALRGLAGYPVSMVTVPGEAAANSNPPTLALLALGVTHTGLALTLERPARGLLERPHVWTTTVFVNGVIMTLYLWHATVMVLLVGIAELPGGVGLRFVPNTLGWWASRPVWLLVLSLALAGVVAAVGIVEAHPQAAKSPPASWRSVAGALAVCAGLLALAGAGIGGGGPLGVRLWPVLLCVVGALLVRTR
jgi:fucose 4-O-acetylase-like acetyltransferase